MFYGKANKKKHHPVQLPRVYLLAFSLGVPPNLRKTSLLSRRENIQTNSVLFSLTFVSDEKAGIGGGFQSRGGIRHLLIKQNPIYVKPICDSTAFTLPKEVLAISLTNFIKKCDMLDL